MRVCVVYDCLFPHTVGGAERWYRNLAERLAEEGHEVTYLTLRQWERGAEADIDPRVTVVCAGPRMSLYTGGGRRRILPPLVFGLGVLRHLLRHGSRYEVVHTDSFPYFSVLAAGLARRLHGYRLAVDWFEIWSPDYWRSYLGPLGGRVGLLVQRLCARVPQQAFCFSERHAARLAREGLRGEPIILRGLFRGSDDQADRPPDAPTIAPTLAGEEPDGDASAGDPLVFFAGRLIPEKRVALAVAGVAAARRLVPGLRAVFYGDGPQRGELLQAIAREGLQDIVQAPGFAPGELVEADQRRAACMLSTSSREGYGMVVVEAASRGVPSIVVAGEDNAAVELIEEGVNGVVVPAPRAALVGEAIASVVGRGEELRGSTAGWYRENAQRLSIESSLRRVLAFYSSARA